MSSPFGMYGGASYASPESRALGSITKESYDYRDQGKTISKLIVDVSYLAGMQRKMQKGIDDANQNFMQQIQSLINDIIAIFAGGGDTGFDFGDLKYLFQALGALFGLEPGMPFPINLFNAAWHFFSNYILPLNNFEEVINLIIDGLIATVLDIFGEIPIVGEALQQLAVIIRNVVDGVAWVFEAIGNILRSIFGEGSLEDFLDGVFDIVLWIPKMIGQLIKNGILGIKSALNALNIFGKIQPNNIDRVPLQALFQGRVNALDAPTFNSLQELASDEFVYDPTVSYRRNEGSAKCVADGFDHELYSNEMAVDDNTEVNIEVQVKYENLVSSTSPVKMRLAMFAQGVELEVVDIKTIPWPGGTSKGWFELQGEYKIPPGIEEVRMTLYVSGDATAGTVWFAGADMTKNYVTGIAPIDWIIDLPEALGGLDEFIQWVIDSFMEAIDGIFGDGTPLGEFIETFIDWVDDIFITMGESADALFQALGISKILTRIFGGQEEVGLAETEQAVLDLNGRIVALEGVGSVITHTISGIWTNPTPTEHNPITFVVVNGGDGGSRGTTSAFDTAKGGDSGGYIQKSFYTDELPATVAMTIGAGGAGNTVSGGGPGGIGAITSFGSQLIGLKGVGAVFKPGNAIPYDTGVAPGSGGDGAYYTTGSNGAMLLASTHGLGGPFAPGGRAGFGDTSSETNGKNGSVAPAAIPSGGGGGGGGSISTTGTSGNGGAGGFPGGGGGGGAREGASYRNGGNGAAGCIYEIRHWEE